MADTSYLKASAMARIFYRKVVEGEMTLEQVPELWREEVRKILEENTVHEEHAKPNEDK